MIFFIYSFVLLGAGGVCGLLLNGIFCLWGGGVMFGKTKTGNSFGGGVY